MYCSFQNMLQQKQQSTLGGRDFFSLPWKSCPCRGFTVCHVYWQKRTIFSNQSPGCKGWFLFFLDYWFLGCYLNSLEASVCLSIKIGFVTVLLNRRGFHVLINLKGLWKTLKFLCYTNGKHYFYLLTGKKVLHFGIRVAIIEVLLYARHCSKCYIA